MKQFLAILTAIWLMLALAWAATAQASETTTMYVHVRSGTFLNGRSKPDLHSQIMMRMERGFQVDVIEADNGWARIQGGEAGTCWCCVKYLADYPPDASPAVSTVVSNGRVRVRKSPHGDTAGYVRDGDTVEVRFVIDGWAYIGNGYVMAEYLTNNTNR